MLNDCNKLKQQTRLKKTIKHILYKTDLPLLLVGMLFHKTKIT